MLPLLKWTIRLGVAFKLYMLSPLDFDICPHWNTPLGVQLESSVAMKINDVMAELNGIKTDGYPPNAYWVIWLISQFLFLTEVSKLCYHWKKLTEFN